jgi:hypothetical protein
VWKARPEPGKGLGRCQTAGPLEMRLRVPSLSGTREAKRRFKIRSNTGRWSGGVSGLRASLRSLYRLLEWQQVWRSR